MEIGPANALPITIGLLMPPLISFIKDVAWPRQGKIAVALVISCLGGIASAWVRGGLMLTLENVMVDVAIVVVEAQAFYRLWFQASTFEASLRSIGGNDGHGA